MKVAFLDRDGTINRDYPDEVWPHITEPELLPGSIEGLRHIIACGYEIIIVTNQYLIGEGFITEADYKRFTHLLLSCLRENGIEILDIFHCPHRRNEDCSCLKPRPGMIEAALRKYPDIDMTQSFLAGDSSADEALARAVHLPFYGIGRGEHPISSLSGLIPLIH